MEDYYYRGVNETFHRFPAKITWKVTYGIAIRFMFVGIRIPYTICSLDTYSVYELFFWILILYTNYFCLILILYTILTYEFRIQLYDFNIRFSYTSFEFLTYDLKQI